MAFYMECAHASTVFLEGVEGSPYLTFRFALRRLRVNDEDISLWNKSRINRGPVLHKSTPNKSLNNSY